MSQQSISATTALTQVGAVFGVMALAALGLPQQSRAATIADHLGIAVHMDAKLSHYGAISDTYDKALWVGVSHLRGQAPGVGDLYTMNAMLAACDRGLSWTLIVMGDPAKYWSNIDTIAARPGCLHALEGPNEINVTPPIYGTLRGYPAGIAIQKALYAKAKADPLTATVPVYSLTVAIGGPTAALGNISAYADAANSHDYMSYSYPPNCCLMTMAKMPLAFAPGRPMVITETGYRTMPNTANATDDMSQERLLLYTVLDALRAGVSDVSLYQLLDALPDPTNTGNELHWGLFDGKYNPESIKASAYGFHYLMGLIGASTLRSPVGATVAKPPAQTNILTSVGTDGTTYLTLSAEQVVWNATTMTPNPLTTTNTTMALGGTYASVKVYDVVTNGSNPVATYSNVSSIPLSISADPLVIALH